MPAKQIMFDQKAREALLRGVARLSGAVKVTLGPRGRTVMFDRSWGAPTVTKDGVTVAGEIELRDPFENIGARMVREAANRTSDMAGDGTTTATVLAESMFRVGLRNVAAGANPMALKRGIDAAVTAIVEELARLSTPVEDRQQIADVGAISANGDRMVGETLADAMDKVGKDGTITVEEGQTIETTLEIVEGMQFDKGYMSPYFVTEAESTECLLEDCAILIHERKLSRLPALLPLLQKVAQQGKPLLIIAEGMEGDVLATLVVNMLRGTITCCAVKAPGFGDRRRDILEDIAALTGGTCITEELGIRLEDLDFEQLGKAKRVLIDRDTTTIVAGPVGKNAVAGRMKQLRRQIEDTTSDHDRERLQERLSKLAGGVGVIRVGAATEAEMKEKKARVEDALHATRAAVEEGIVAGGGVALLRAVSALDALKSEGDERVGVSIVRRAIEEPLRQIAGNAGVEGAVVLQEVKRLSGTIGYDAERGEYVDMIEAGILDPTKVVRCALQNAASVAGLLLTMECAVAEAPTKRTPAVYAQADEDGH